jgi:antirestriction protein ArdC
MKATANRAPREDVYTRVTAKIVASLEKGVRPWVKPWNSTMTGGNFARPSRHNGQSYRGINVLILWADATEKGFISPFWMTYKQAVEMKAQVRKGQHGSTVVFADRFTRTETDLNGEDVEEAIPFLKAYTVFNAEQVEGLPARYYSKPADPLLLSERAAGVDAFVTKTKAQVSHGGNAAFYTAGLDCIQMPHFEAFRDTESYYGTLLHELTHWTGHKSRLDRDFGRKAFGDAGYAREELVAELGAAFLCADLAISLNPREDHAAYLGHWLEVLRQDKRAVFQAAAYAQKSSDFLQDLQAAESSAA